MKRRRWRALDVALGIAMTGCMPASVWRSASPDHTTRVAVREQNGRSCVMIDAQAARCADAVSLPGVAFAARGGSVAYPARIDGRWVVVHDGRAGRSWNGVGVPVLSADGAHVAYPANGGTEWRVVVDDTPGEAFDAIIAGTLGFDSTGEHVGYVARRGDSSHVVIDRVSSRGWTVASGPIFAGDGSSAAYVAWLGAAAMTIVDGQPGGSHDAISGLAYSRSRSAWAYAARDAGAWQVVGGASPLGPFDDVRDVRWPPNRLDSQPAFVARAGGAEFVVLDGVAQRRHARVSSLAFDAAGTRWGYIADSGAVYIDGDLLASEEAAADLVIADDGTRFAYVGVRAGSTAVVERGARYAFDLIVPGTLEFLHQGRSWACLAGDRTKRVLFVVVDGRRTERRLDWEEVVRMVQLPDAGVALRAMVAVEARLALAGQSSTP